MELPGAATQKDAQVKIQVINPRERIQWVSARTLDAGRYREPNAPGDAQRELAEIAKLIDGQQLDVAYARLQKAIANAQTDSASLRMLQADSLAYNGELARARQVLVDASQRYAVDLPTCSE